MRMGLQYLSDYIERALADGDGAPPIYPDYALWPLPPLDVWLLLMIAFVALIAWLFWPRG